MATLPPAEALRARADAAANGCAVAAGAAAAAVAAVMMRLQFCKQHTQQSDVVVVFSSAAAPLDFSNGDVASAQTRRANFSATGGNAPAASDQLASSAAGCETRAQQPARRNRLLLRPAPCAWPSRAEPSRGCCRCWPARRAIE